ncbi:GCN5 family acetyltransferase [Methylobacterium sp. Leaf399]|uniref:GNAT family N-acetyltransferase n=1 Tax=Methylobacterium sp. Leaf399 TaxID=1736364 RepID=UPI0006FE7416|nr:GNAT family N-acetyltransferase [Methylobacterium sp. Leaf399]KQT11898.1 GCN5 family acetyltransferase [Methylobacterium sp. Leaf399]
MSPGGDEPGLRSRWRDLVERRLPEAAPRRPDWPVDRDHCFARILLDNACGGPWRAFVAAPAWANTPADDLSRAVDLGEAVLAGKADLALLNRRSLGFRGKLRTKPVPACLHEGDLTLRRWSPADDDAFAALNADAEVMRFFPAPRSRGDSLAEARAHDRRFAADGFGPWVLDCAEEGVVGFVGGLRLMRPMPFSGAERPGNVVEVVWRLARSAWGRGLATRAARLALADLFGRCGVAAAVAFTAAGNAPSRRVMERLGMVPAGEFAHPALPPDDRLAPHVLYRVSAADFSAGSMSP